MGVVVKLNKLPTMAARLRVGAGEIVAKVADDIRAQAQSDMAAPKSGRVYRRGRGRMHVASAPGEAPAVDRGTLINSLRSMRVSDTRAVVAATAEHAVYMEFGTRHIAPRPFLEPAARKVAEQLPRRVSALVEVLR